MNSYKIFIDSAAWLCEGNLIESSRIYRYIIDNGHRLIINPSEADFIIINTCGFIKEREVKSVDLLKKYNSLKKESAKIIMFGCLVKINPGLMNSLDIYTIDLDEDEKLDKIFYKKTKFKDVKPYCDNETIQKLLIKKNIVKETKCPVLFLTDFMSLFLKKLRIKYNKVIDSVTYKNKVLVEICRGCTSNCNYCLIKRAKGNVKSRPIKDILSDIEKTKNPSKNLFLVADDCSCYGLDIKTNLFNLIYDINKKFPDLSIDLDEINPYWLEKYPEEFITLFKNININFAVIPLQSGSNKVLKNMNRQYDITKVIKIIDKIKKVSPRTFIYSHFIVGYPGETWIDFLKTLTCAVHFDIPIVLKYSEHEGSASSSLPEKKSMSTILIRENILNYFLNFIIFYKFLFHPMKN